MSQQNEEFDFNQPERPMVRARRARRVPFITLTAGDGDGNVEVRIHPHLHRQNAMVAHVDGRNVWEFVGRLLAARNEDQLPKINLWQYVLVPAQSLEEAWECSVCLDNEKHDVVWHPGNCHCFHEVCLQQWMGNVVSCPLCRNYTSPLMMKAIE